MSGDRLNEVGVSLRRLLGDVSAWLESARRRCLPRLEAWPARWADHSTAPLAAEVLCLGRRPAGDLPSDALAALRALGMTGAEGVGACPWEMTSYRGVFTVRD